MNSELNDLGIRMKRKRFVAVAWSILLVLPFVSGTALSEEGQLSRGAQLLAPLKGDLKQALMAGMQGGPLNAISVCKDQAPAIAASHSVEGVKIGRTSHRLRNPANLAQGLFSSRIKSARLPTSSVPNSVSFPIAFDGLLVPVASAS